MIGILAASTPAPTPLEVHVVTDGAAPVWLAPLLTGAFVLAAAGIALFSLYLSDQRKLRREDQRQWDSELQAAYVTIAAEVARSHVAMTRSMDPFVRLQQVVSETEQALSVVMEQTKLLELIAPKNVSEAAKQVGDVLGTLWQTAFEEQMASEHVDREELSLDDDAFLGSPPRMWQHIKAANDQVDALKASVREALRIDPK